MHGERRLQGEGVRERVTGDCGEDACGMAAGDREGRDGVTPPSTHFLGNWGDKCGENGFVGERGDDVCLVCAAKFGPMGRRACRQD